MLLESLYGVYESHWLVEGAAAGGRAACSESPAGVVQATLHGAVQHSVMTVF